MEKPGQDLSDEIAEWVKTKGSGNGNRAAFLVQQDAIKKAIKDGWKIKTIWEVLRQKKRLDFSLPTFYNYVNRLNLGSPNIKVPEGIKKTSGTFGFDNVPEKKDLF